MRIGILGASGRVGTRLVELVLASPGLDLAAALVSPSSRLVGTAVAGGSVEYRPADAAIKSHCDVMIDFSTPTASLALQREIGTKPIPVVIGTSGFSAEGRTELAAASAHRPLLLAANLAPSFEAFRRAVAGLASAVPSAEVSVAETFRARKTGEPSCTSRVLARSVFQARSHAMGFAAPEPEIAVDREGEVMGVNEVRFDLGTAEIVLTYRIHAVSAYAEGAIAAARWLASRPPGLYGLADSFNDE